MQLVPGGRDGATLAEFLISDTLPQLKVRELTWDVRYVDILGVIGEIVEEFYCILSCDRSSSSLAPCHS